MNETKKKGLLKIAGIMLVIMLFALCIVSGTMAKYTSKSNDITFSQNVAKWDIEAGGAKLENLSSLTFNIYDTVAGSSNEEADENVATEMIAPGTWGYAQIAIENKGNVDAKITATLTDSKTTLPTGMTVTLLTEKPSGPSVISSSTKSVTVDKLEKAGGSATTTLYVAFVWVFGDGTNDGNDTPFGTAGAALELGTLAVVADQID